MPQRLSTAAQREERRDSRKKTMPRKRKKRPRRKAMLTIELNRGHVTAELVRDADLDGNAVVHAINRRQSAADRLYDEGLLKHHQWQAACDLKGIWLKARPVPDVEAFDPAKPGGTFGEGAVDPRADRQLRAFARALGREAWFVVQRLVYDDIDPRTWSNVPAAAGLRLTKLALDKLAAEMGLA